MKSSTVKTALIALVLLLSAQLSLAVESKPDTTAAPKAKAGTTSVKAAKKAPVANIKLVDINSAGKGELKKLPGISEADADKIIAARPYLSKAFLVTRNVISAAAYQGVKKLIIAKQKNPATAKKLH